MNLQKHAAAVFRDFEKLYRLAGMYSGDLRQIQQQLSIVDSNIDANLRKVVPPGSGMEFDFLMTVVYFEGEEIFRPKQPEYSVSHALFCEGLKSILFRPALGAQELLDWLMTVRSILGHKDLKDDVDLASVLWKKNSPNIQISLYSQLAVQESGPGDLTKFNVREDTDEFESDFEKEVLQSEFTRGQEGMSRLDKSWFERDDAWDIPDGQLALRLKSLGERDPQLAERLRAELGDAAITDRARKIMRFQTEELARVRKEVEHYDENQVSFNTIVSLLEALARGDRFSAEHQEELLQMLKLQTEAVVSRFHAGMLLFLLTRVASWEQIPRLNKIREEVLRRLSECLVIESNLKAIAEAFELENRRAIASKLLTYMSPKAFQYIFDHLGSQKKLDAQRFFLKSLIELKKELEETVLTWSEDSVVAAIPALLSQGIPNSNQFLLRCLKSRHSRVRAAVCEEMYRLDLQADAAMALFVRFEDSSKRLWLESLVKQSKLTSWAGFVQLGMKQRIWQKSSDDLLALWVRLAFKYFGPAAWSAFEAIVTERKLLFFPAHAAIRATILEVMLSINDPHLRGKIAEIAAQESRTLFQAVELRSRLKEYSGR